VYIISLGIIIIANTFMEFIMHQPYYIIIIIVRVVLL
jgi:hypothetical protein